MEISMCRFCFLKVDLKFPLFPGYQPFLLIRFQREDTYFSYFVMDTLQCSLHHNHYAKGKTKTCPQYVIFKLLFQKVGNSTLVQSQILSWKYDRTLIFAWYLFGLASTFFLVRSLNWFHLETTRMSECLVFSF